MFMSVYNEFGSHSPSLIPGFFSYDFFSCLFVCFESGFHIQKKSCGICLLEFWSLVHVTPLFLYMPYFIHSSSWLAKTILLKDLFYV